MDTRRLDIFFYGLFMDQELLIAKGVHPTNIRLASVRDFVLRIGERAALVREHSGRVYGVVMSLSHNELDKLYSEPSLRAYRPEAVLADMSNGEVIAALCYNLPEPPSRKNHNANYASKLRLVAQKIGLPAEYIASIQ